MNIQSMAIALSIITVASAILQAYAAFRLLVGWVSLRKQLALIMFGARAYTSLWWFLIAGLMAFGGTLGSIRLTLPTIVSIVVMFSYLLMHVAVALFALVEAGIFKPAEPAQDTESTQ